MKAIPYHPPGGKYIRPIVLFQAQPRIGEDCDTFDKVKKMLINMSIPEDQIAVKTSGVDDLKGQNLMSRDCTIRYIITVNALKEGWDCPFAYILASLANRTSTVDVEQILGRILRQPYAEQHVSPLLNTSYVLTNSADFHSTLEKIVVGLNKAGFSRKDYRLGETVEVPQTPAQPEAVQTEIPMELQPPGDELDDVDVQEVRAALESGAPENTAITAMVQEAAQQAASYNAEINEPGVGFMGGELGEMLTQNKIQAHFQHACDIQEGQVWITNGWQKPEGMCDSAWESLSAFVMTLAHGGENFYNGWMKNPKSAMISCNDGFWPVSFYIEALDEEAEP